MKRYYPVGLDLTDRDVLVVGGGPIAEGKIEQLLDCEARVTLVSPTATARLSTLAAVGALRWVERAFEPSDVAHAWIVIAASDDRSANAAVAEAARAAGRLVNAVDDVPNCDFIAMSVLRRGELQVAISTGGGSPAMARWLREELEARLPEELGQLLDLLAEARLELKASGAVPPYVTWRRAITDEVLGLLADGAFDAARARLSEALSAPPTGVVYLVGAGPGDPGLITRRGAELLRSADVVVHDRLVDRRLLSLCRAGAELVDVGKAPGDHCQPQDAINRQLVEHARRGRVVVRLKGGDPFVFGRGGEEASALAAAGLRFEVVPGVSAAVAAPACAGIPVTHRGVASAFTVVTGHGADDETAIDRALAAYGLAGGTLVVLMGLGRLPAVVARLRAAGCPPDRPVAVVQSASGPDQRTVVATLADVVDRVAASGISSPAAVVVGEVVRLRDRIAWKHETRAEEIAWS